MAPLGRVSVSEDHPKEQRAGLRTVLEIEMVWGQVSC